LNYGREYIKRLEANFEARENVTENDKQQSSIQYWDNYYSNENILDSWYCEFDTIQNYLPFLSDKSNALVSEFIC
jgi:hypothetical protein